MSRPHIWLDNGRWHVFAVGWPVHGYILLSSAQERARAIWERKK